MEIGFPSRDSGMNDGVIMTNERHAFAMSLYFRLSRNRFGDECVLLAPAYRSNMMSAIPHSFTFLVMMSVGRFVFTASLIETLLKVKSLASPCHAAPRHALPCRALPRRALPCSPSYEGIPRHTDQSATEPLPCLAL